MLPCVRKPCLHAAPYLIQTQLKFTLHRTASYLLFKYPLTLEKKLALYLTTYKKIDFWGTILEGFHSVGPLKPCQNICLLNIR